MKNARISQQTELRNYILDKECSGPSVTSDQESMQRTTEQDSKINRTWLRAEQNALSLDKVSIDIQPLGFSLQ